MAKTFHRRKNLFRKRRANPLKIIITVLCCAGLVTGGYFGARFLMEGGLNPPASSVCGIVSGRCFLSRRLRQFPSGRLLGDVL